MKAAQITTGNTTATAAPMMHPSKAALPNRPTSTLDSPYSGQTSQTAGSVIAWPMQMPVLMKCLADKLVLLQKIWLFQKMLPELAAPPEFQMLRIPIDTTQTPRL